MLLKRINGLTSHRFLTIFKMAVQAAGNGHHARRLPEISEGASGHAPPHPSDGLDVRTINAFEAGVIAFAAAMNVAVGYIVSALKLPLYLDSIGTVLVGALFGWVYGVIAGIAGLLVFAVTAAPTVVAYAGTAVVIAILSSLLFRIGFLRRPGMTLAGGVILGIGAATASVPVTTFLYGGVSLAGADAVTGMFRALGLPLWQSVVIGSLITDIVDKVATAFICLAILKSLPPRMKRRFPAYRSRSGE